MAKVATTQNFLRCKRLIRRVPVEWAASVNFPVGCPQASLPSASFHKMCVANIRKSGSQIHSIGRIL